MYRLASYLRRGAGHCRLACPDCVGRPLRNPVWLSAATVVSDSSISAAGPAPRSVQKRRGRASWRPRGDISTSLEDEAPQDILEDFDPEETGEDAEHWEDASHSASSGTGTADSNKAGPLARRMMSSALRGVRCEQVWGRYAQRVLMTSALAGAQDVAVMFFAFARIKYRDLKVLEALSPFILRHIDDFTVTDLVLLMNAHKKLEYERLDTLQLLLSALVLKWKEWTGRHVSLMTNAVAYFYIYHAYFWKLIGRALPKLVWTMNPLELSNTVSAMARVDRRDAQSLMMLARMCRRCAQRNLFSQETLATSMNAFAKLDFNHPRLMRAFTEATVVKLDRALGMGRDYRCSSLRDIDVFDVQALVQVLHTLACLVDAPDDVIVKLLTLVSWSRAELGNYQLRVVKTSIRCVKAQRPTLWGGLPRDVKEAFYIVEHSPVQVSTFESRWSKELSFVLKKMDIIIERKPVVDDQVVDIIMPTSKAAVYAVGPYGYYANTTERTAYSKLHQRLLEMEGYTCMAVPYYEWSELRTEEDKMVYLWSLGRRAAVRKDGGGASGEGLEIDPASEAEPAVVNDEELQSDLGDLDAPFDDAVMEAHTKRKVKP